MINENKFLVRFYFVDWGFKFPVRCAYRKPEIDEIPNYENLPFAEKKRYQDLKEEKIYSFDNLTSSVFNEQFAESGK